LLPSPALWKLRWINRVIGKISGVHLANCLSAVASCGVMACLISTRTVRLILSSNMSVTYRIFRCISNTWRCVVKTTPKSIFYLQDRILS
jgi:hypothetical protein